jgi:transcriptional regulator with XRE-family HTH domain
MAKGKNAVRSKEETAASEQNSEASRAENNSISKENYGPRIKELRIACKLTQGKVASALGVTPGYISNVENNRTAMSLRILIYFARLTGQTLDSLVGSLEPEYKANALDNKLFEQISRMSDSDKEKLIKTLKIWE